MLSPQQIAKDNFKRKQPPPIGRGFFSLHAQLFQRLGVFCYWGILNGTAANPANAYGCNE